MIGVGELTTYWRAVPAIGAVCGAPSNRGAKVGPPTRLTTAVCGYGVGEEGRVGLRRSGHRGQDASGR